MILKEALEYGKAVLKEAGISEYDLDAWLLLEHITGITKAMYYVSDRKEMGKSQEEAYREAILKRSVHIPLQHITGVQEFMGYEFSVNEHVLIPRQDTEILVEEAEKYLNTCRQDHIRILDMCTGSGCILLSLLKRSQKNVTGVGGDISKKALETAGENRNRLKVAPEDAVFVRTDLFEKIEERFQLIVSNPPYIRTKEIEKLEEEVKIYDPYPALDGKEDGLYFYRRIIKSAPQYLTDGGALLFEIGCDQAEDVSAMMDKAGFSGIYVKKDLAGLDRVVGGVYNRPRKN